MRRKLFKKLFSISSKLLFNFFEDFQIFLKIFKFFLKCYPGFSNFLHFCKISLKFLKTITKFFRIPKFHQEFRNINFCTPMYLRSFFKISFHLIIIQSCTLMSAKLLQEKCWKFSRNFIKIFSTILLIDYTPATLPPPQKIQYYAPDPEVNKIIAYLNNISPLYMYKRRGSMDVMIVYTPISNLYPSIKRGLLINSCTNVSSVFKFKFSIFSIRIPR